MRLANKGKFVPPQRVFRGFLKLFQYKTYEIETLILAFLQLKENPSMQLPSCWFFRPLASTDSVSLLAL
jgi:hypothetical protein